MNYHGNLEQYLKNATRGLIGKRKLDVREELENHVLEQAHKLELQGFNHADAIEKVLEQIGPASIVSSGMIGVHTMPTMIRSILASLALALTSALFATNIQAQSIHFNTEAESFRSWLEISKLRVKDAGTNFEITFPDSPRIVRINVIEQKSDTTNAVIRLISFAEFLETTARETQLPVRINGWTPMTLQIGSSRLQFPDAALFYSETLDPVFQSLGFKGLPNQDGPACEHRLTVTDKPGTAYALLTTASLLVSNAADAPQTRYNLFDVAPVGSNGSITFHIPAQTLEFTNDIKRITQPQRPIANDQALLIRLTGRFNPTLEYETILPTETITQGSKCRWF
jgi:hypothetical protein